ncbi:hypothetical protein KDW_46980 [Dictyobacter vulcani]|uniref:Photosynthesis system II assembly factor Ycf48/Hcf136-like domain-containing protein n=1 Tax=Dictyobacter vulcani TaxID=2607529 RepID=A0A5J4KZA1_9CHLR|nr:hypothetical protein [Dictyobacter vulcani]GER90536.1 hypothetical protein KDW_46980 [Dictyobacter vulcani]
MKRFYCLPGVFLALLLCLLMQVSPVLAAPASTTKAQTCKSWQDTYDPQANGPLDSMLWSIARVNNHDMWSVGFAHNQTAGTEQIYALHWNGTRWTPKTPAQPSMNPSSLNGVTAIASNDVWAVGSYMDATEQRNDLTLAEHWNGKTWTRIATPSPQGGFTNISDDLKAVTAFSSSDVWAVGSKEGPVGVLLEHWNGKQWSVLSLPYQYEDQLTAISGTSSKDIWVVGQRMNGHMFVPLVEHWNGKSWTVVPNQAQTFGGELYSVKAIAANDVWAVGNYDAPNSSSSQALIEHWNGSKWSMVASPQGGASSMAYLLNAVTATATNDVWAAGSVVDTSPLLEHWNGKKWSIAVGPTQQTNYNAINAITAVPGMVWGAGTDFGEEPMAGYYCS